MRHCARPGGEPDLAAQHLLVARRLADEAGTPYPIWLNCLAAADVELALGNHGQAHSWLDQAEPFAAVESAPWFLRHRLLLSRSPRRAPVSGLS